MIGIMNKVAVAGATAVLGIVSLFSGDIFESHYDVDKLLRLESPEMGADEAATGSSAEVEVKQGLVKESGVFYYYEDGKRVKNTLITKGKKKYYFGKDGKAYKSKWKVVDGKWYFFGKKCVATIGSAKINKKYRVFDDDASLVRVTKKKTVTVKKKKYLVKGKGYAVSGWNKVKEKWLHTKKNGAYDLRKKVGYIKMNGKGFAKWTEQYDAKRYARKFIKKHSKKSDSKREKFRKCFRHIMAGTCYVGDWRPQGFGKKGWQYRSAAEMLGGGLVGDCYGVSCAVAAVAKELGYQPYVIWAAHSHAFVIIDGKYYDNMHGAKFGTTTHDPYKVKEKFKF